MMQAPMLGVIDSTNHLSPAPELNVFITCIAFSQIDSGSKLRSGKDLVPDVLASVVTPTEPNLAVL